MNYLQTYSFSTMSSIKRLAFGLILLGTAISCDDVLEEDITNDLITVVAPLDGTVVSGNSVQFLWNSLDGADDYAVQVYNQGTVVVDSVVSGPPFTMILNSDSYQWRVKGQNFAYETPFSFPQEFEVESSDDLTNQLVSLTSPTADFYTNVNTLIFNWEPLTNATRYSFNLTRITSAGEALIYQQDDLTTTSLTLTESTLAEDAEYRWELRAINDDNATQTDTSSRIFFIDTVVPNVPNLLTPGFEEEFLVDSSIAFTWSYGTDTGTVASAITSSYEVAQDEGFSTIIISGETELTSFSEAFSNPGTYYWRVRGEDLAGNEGGYNLNGKFIVNE